MKNISTIGDIDLLEYWSELWELGGLVEFDSTEKWNKYSAEYVRVMSEVEYRGGLQSLAQKIKKESAVIYPPSATVPE